MVYGFEGDDLITGGPGTNRLFGDGGDDLIILANTPTRIGDAIPGSGSFSSPRQATAVLLPMQVVAQAMTTLSEHSLLISSLQVLVMTL